MSAVGNDAARLQAILDSTPDAVITIDRSGVVQSVNAAAVEMFGHERADMLGQNVKMLMAPGHREGHDGYLSHYLETGERKIIGKAREVEAMRKGGERIWIKLWVTDMRERGEDLFLGIAQDVTRRRAAEEEASRLAQADLLKTELSALVVHDLKSPTSGLLMLSQMQLRKKDLPEAERSRWRLVYSSAETLQRMILNLLDISRSEDGALKLDADDVDLSGLVDEVHDVLRFQMEERAHRFTAEIDEGAAWVHADRDLIRRVLLNLVDNACRHTPARDRIRVRGERHGDRVRIRVINAGATIAPEDRERVFEKYVRLDAEVGARVSPGRGLGLPFCRTAVEAHGGRIWVEAPEDIEDGTAFCLELPAGERPGG